MILTLYVENRIPGDGRRKFLCKLYLNHIAVNKLRFGKFCLCDFQHFL